MDKNPPTYRVPRQQTSEDRNGGGKEVDKETGKSGGGGSILKKISI